MLKKNHDYLPHLTPHMISYMSVVNHLKRLGNAFRFRVPFYRRAGFVMPAHVKIGKRKVELSYPNESGILNDFIVCFINDEYGLAQTAFPVKTIVDIGSNAGFFSLTARSWFPSAKIHAYEPNPRMLPNLMKNLGITEIDIYPEAVGATEVLVSVVDVGNSNLAKTSAVVDEQTGIQQVSLSKVIERMGGQIDLAKIDCEGAEWDMFADTLAWNNIKSVRMEYHLWGGHDYSEVVDTLISLGFHIYHHSPDGEIGTVWADRIIQL